MLVALLKDGFPSDVLSPVWYERTASTLCFNPLVYM